ncbi:DsbA family oxidoreductase [Undibacterium sp.]|jgi:predicted DsbA family dithiol-disulfide isomerase|uniref:DsbA family oxidoreductase n=1 Tax=Undibacterium sp. TaxID=1914977 RepID=UPI002D0EF096|nr:DsbA family oxidoreductase [Undibacterium sp.]HTD06162.1 DsbA family oxidoreductase [Undibacterium sp.]
MNTPTTQAVPAATLKIDFVSDVSCPWCIIGLKSLEQALDRIGGQVKTELHFQPFELNPNMGSEGQDITEHLAEKYGASAEQSERNREAIRARGAAVGFSFNMEKRGRIYNTFDAHRLLHWAELEGKQHALKNALFEAYFTNGQDPSSHQVLLAVVEQVGLDRARALQILSSDEYAQDVRLQEQFYLNSGVNSVPAVIINDKHLISGGQPVEVFERALRQIAAGN